MRAADYLGGPAAVARRARGVLSQPPPVGANVVIVGHGNVIRAATGFYPDEGGSGVFPPGTASHGSAELVGWLSPAEWIRLGKVRK